jgi:type IV fimbrial biogenesis protein FimT
MVMAIALLAWLFSSGQYSRFLEQQALESQLSRVAAAMMKGRSEAITRNAAVQVCIANLKSNLDIQGCLHPAITADGYPLSEGLLLFVDKVGGRTGVYDSKEVNDMVTLPPAGRVSLFSSVDSYHIRGSGALSVPAGVTYTARTSSGLCRRLRVLASGFRSVETC